MCMKKKKYIYIYICIYKDVFDYSLVSYTCLLSPIFGQGILNMSVKGTYPNRDGETAVNDSSLCQVQLNCSWNNTLWGALEFSVPYFFSICIALWANTPFKPDKNQFAISMFQSLTMIIPVTLKRPHKVL